eukprot:Polyplicarium_translucidae@DN3223_c1_g1_i1.p1
MLEGDKQADEAPKKLSAKEERKAAREAASAASRVVEDKIADHAVDCYGTLPIVQSTGRTDRVWTSVGALEPSLAGTHVWIRARLHELRMQGGSLAFLTLREQLSTVQAVFEVPKGMKAAAKWVSALARESVVDIYGVVNLPQAEVVSTTQSKVEIAAEKVFCVSKSQVLPFQLHDANRPEKEQTESIRVLQDVRLDNRVLDLRTFEAQAAFRVQSAVCQLYRNFMLERGFMEIHSPKTLGGASEGGSSVFTFQYFGRTACLAQSPQLYKQMALCGDFDRVFEIGPVFRAENSNTHRHLCEFVGLDFEMTIKETYLEVLDMIEALFKTIFRGLMKGSAKEVDIICKHHGVKPFEWIEDTPRLTFAEGMAMLKEDGADIPEDLSAFDMNTEQEKQLGALVKKRFGTDFYILHRYPLKVRPFYTMPCADDPTLSTSYDVFMRGEEIISGAQRVHEPAMLASRATECGVPPESIQPYIDSFKLGAFPHGGAGIGLERVVMLFLGLGNIRKTSLFPRDPKRLAP